MENTEDGPGIPIKSFNDALAEILITKVFVYQQDPSYKESSKFKLKLRIYDQKVRAETGNHFENGSLHILEIIWKSENTPKSNNVIDPVTKRFGPIGKRRK